MNESLVPANTKKATLILGMFRKIDLIIVASGTLSTILLLSIFPNVTTLMMILFCIPMFVCAFLVMPIPNYHNVLVVLQSIWSFYNNRRSYIWRGWCIRNEYKD